MKVTYLCRTCRGFHLIPTLYPEVNQWRGLKQRRALLVWLWWSWEVIYRV